MAATVIKVTALLGFLAALTSSAANATESSTPTTGFLGADHHARGAPPIMKEDARLDNGSLRGAGAGALYDDGKMAVGFCSGRFVRATLISYQVPFLLSSIGMPPSDSTRQAAAGSSSSASGMSRPSFGGWSAASRARPKVRKSPRTPPVPPSSLLHGLICSVRQDVIGFRAGS